MVKLTDIPDMNYYAKNGEGEVSIQITGKLTHQPNKDTFSAIRGILGLIYQQLWKVTRNMGLTHYVRNTFVRSMSWNEWNSRCHLTLWLCVMRVRSVSGVTVSSEGIWRMRRGRERRWTLTAGFTLETWDSGCRWDPTAASHHFKSLWAVCMLHIFLL